MPHTAKYIIMFIQRFYYFVNDYVLLLSRHHCLFGEYLFALLYGKRCWFKFHGEGMHFPIYFGDINFRSIPEFNNYNICIYSSSFDKISSNGLLQAEGILE